MGDCSEIEEKVCVTFTWKIENLLWNVREKDVIISPEFMFIINKSDTKWRLRVFPCIREKEISDCFLRRVDGEKPERITVGFELLCITADGKTESVYRKDHQEFVKNSPRHGAENWSWLKMLEKRSLYFPDGIFTIRCVIWSCFRQVIHPVEYVALTHFEVMNISFLREIHDFDSFNSSLPITFSQFPGEDLEIILCKKEGSEYLSAEFRWNILIMPKIRLNCKQSVQNHKGTILNEKEGNYLFNSDNRVWKFPDFIKVSELALKDRYFEKDLKLRIDIKMHFGKSYSTINEVRNIQSLTISEDDLLVLTSQSRELEVLYTEKRYADVEIRSGEESFPTHKFLLCARSPVFAAMFGNEMVEKETGVVQIDDVDAETLDKFLSFMYSGGVKNLDEDMAMKLLCVVDKYQVLTLKKKCSTFLKNTISVQNACEVLQLSDTHHEESLLETAQEFICNHHREIFSSDKWRLFIRQHGELAGEIFKKLSERYAIA